MSFLPKEQQVEEMTFENNKGEILIFKNTNPNWNKRAKIDVETLCERGDFLDKTVQTAYYDAESVHLTYINGTSTNQFYNLNIDLVFQHIGSGKKEDTIFFETITVWGQRLKEPIATGGSDIIINARGNDDRIPAFHKEKQSRFISDTTIDNRRILNVYVTPDPNDKMKIYYSKDKGIEVFTTPLETWFRKI